MGRRQLAHPRVLDLNELVRETMPFLRRLIREDVGLEDALSAGALPVEVDPAQLRQVLLNLATNARDAMPEGGRLTIRTGRRDLAPEAPADEALPGRSVAVLSISDTGHGMDPQTRERIFEPFFTTKPVGRGTGLGLASVHGMVEQAGGRIEVESQPGKGTTFHVLLPCARRPLAPEAPAPVAPQVRSRPATVLVVEDQPMVRAVAARALRAAGYEVLEAEDGSEGLACAAGRESLDLLLTDVVLPRVGGPELAAQLRKRWPQLRILFISGYAPEELRGWPKADPRPDFLPKPFTPEELVAAVARCLEA